MLNKGLTRGATLRIRTQSTVWEKTPLVSSIKSLTFLQQRRPHALFLSFYSHTSLTGSLSWTNSRFKFSLLIRSRFNLTKSFYCVYFLIILPHATDLTQNTQSKPSTSKIHWQVIECVQSHLFLYFIFFWSVDLACVLPWFSFLLVFLINSCFQGGI